MAPVERIGRYEIVTHLASGGMGQVYLARVPGLGGFQRHVVLKTLDVANEVDQAVEMFLDEARVLGLLHHQHIAPVYEVNKDDSRYYLVMDYVHGQTAHDVWQRTLGLGAALPIDFSLTLASAAASGLHYAHTRRGTDGKPLGIVHRDVSLSNLIVGFDGAVKLIDFGIAKAANRASQTQVGFVKGKIGYMAPEQIRGQDVDARTDVFALGIVLYELSTMQRCFREESDRATVERIKQGSFVLPSSMIPDYPRELERILSRALCVDPRERYPDADTLRRELEALGHRLHLVLGDAAVMEVMGQLFEDHREPWTDGRRRSALLDVVRGQQYDDDLTRPAIAARRPLTPKPLRAATEAYVDLIRMLETPPHGFPVTPRKPADTDGVTVVPALPFSADSGVTAVPQPGNASDTSAVTTIGKQPPSARPTYPTAPRKGKTKKVKAQGGPRNVSGWIVASVVFAAAVTGGVLDVFDRASEADPRSPVGKPAPRLLDAGVEPVADASIEAVVDPPVDGASTVRLRITSIPSEATLTLDNQRLGKTPFDGTVDPAPGTHVLNIRRRGYVTVKLELQLVPGEIVQEVTLKRD